MNYLNNTTSNIDVLENIYVNITFRSDVYFLIKECSLGYHIYEDMFRNKRDMIPTILKMLSINKMIPDGYNSTKNINNIIYKSNDKTKKGRIILFDCYISDNYARRLKIINCLEKK